MTERYRVGRSLGRTVYRQVGDDASKDDEFLGIFDDKAMAARVVDLLNAPDALAKVRELAVKAKRRAEEYNRSNEHDYLLLPDVDADDILEALGEADHGG